MDSLEKIYETHKGKVSDKWSSYLTEYNNLFSELRGRNINFLEIGVQNGGSLEIWANFFADAANVVGCDINPNCAKLSYEDRRISLVIGGVNSQGAQSAIRNISSKYDVIIDDGSHLSSDIIRTFCGSLDVIADEAIYVVEDLHCSYWADFEGGVYHPLSSISFFKLIIDVINAEHWGRLRRDVDIFKEFSEAYGIDIHIGKMKHIHSVEFLNSMCVIRFKAGCSGLGTRTIVGDDFTVWGGIVGLNGAENKPPSQVDNKYSDAWYRPAFLSLELERIMLEKDRLASELYGLKSALSDVNNSLLKVNSEKYALETSIELIKSSRSWKLTQPLRYFVSLLRSHGESSRAKVKACAFNISVPALRSVRGWFRRNPSAKKIALLFINKARLRRIYSKLVGKLNSTQPDPKVVGSGVPLWHIFSSSYPRWTQAFDTPSEDDLVLIDSSRASSVSVSVAVWVDGVDLGYIERVTDRLKQSIGPSLNVVFVVSATEDNNRLIEFIKSVCADDDRFSQGFCDEFWDSEFIVIISEGSLPKIHALAMFVYALIDSPEAILAYSDEDISLGGGVVSDPWFKPCFSPLLAQQNKLIGPMFAVRSIYFKPHAGGLNKVSGDQVSLYFVDHFGATEFSKVIRIPHVLYHSVKQPVLRGLSYGVDLKHGHTYPVVTIIIPTKDRWDLLGACLESIWTSKWPLDLLEIIIVDNGSVDRMTLQSLSRLEESGKIKVFKDDGEFNWSRLNNLAGSYSSGDFLIFLNNDTEVHDPEWINKLVYFASKPEIGAVGCKLLYPDLTVQHGGVVAGIHGGAGHAHLFINENDGGYQNLAVLTHEVSAVTGACLAVERNKFVATGGFDEAFKVAFNDIVFCFSLLKMGFYNVYVSDALLIHHESKSRGYDDTPEKQARNREEMKKVLALHADIIKDDPFYSPNLSLYSPYALSFAPRRPSLLARERRYLSKPIKLLLLSCTHAIGHGVAAVLKMHADYLVSNGYEVVIAGPVSQNDYIYPGCTRVDVNDPMDAAVLAAEMSVDLVIAHTPPFFSVARWLGNYPPVLSYDYGEPPTHWFADSEQRQTILEEKDIGLLMSAEVYTISEAILNESRTPVTGVIPLGNTHLGVWSEGAEVIRNRARNKFGFSDCFVVLNVCRFHEGERVYKGVDVYSNLCSKFASRIQDFSKEIIFVLCGKGDPEDVRVMTASGLRVFANVTDAEMFELYCAADAYMNFSKWEGYNLGIAQSLAMGLPTFASDIPAHKAFGIETSNDLEVAVSWIKTVANGVGARKPILFDWVPSLNKLEEIIVSVYERDYGCSCPKFERVK